MEEKPSRIAIFLYPPLESGAAPTLKDIFDNLRNYPILALMSAATTFIPSAQNGAGPATLVFWVFLLCALLMLSAFQTALVLSSCFAYFFGGIRIFQTRWGKEIPFVIGVVIFFFGMMGGIEFATAISSLRTKG